MTTREFDQTIQDLSNFLVYMAEPARLVRYRIGVYAMIFLALLLILTMFLKHKYWRDVK